MVKIGLQISAQFENVEVLKTCHPDYMFYVKVKCSNCGEASDKWHDITESDFVNGDSRNPKGFNFYMKCSLCSRENTMDIISGSNAAYTADDTGKFKTIVAFDCRGIEPFDFSPRAGWIVETAGNGQTFTDVDLSDDDWADYDEKTANSVGISEFKSQFIKLKK